MIWASSLDSLTELRRKLYEQEFLKSEKLAVPVISVGNITMGGTGKTPFVIDLVNRLVARGFKTGVVVKSYNTKLGDPSPIEIGPEAAATYGDEAVLIQNQCPGARVWAGPSKSQTALQLLEVEKGIQGIVVDDGLQHLKLNRDFEIILLDTSVSPQDYEYPPFGRRRETLSVLEKANWVILTKVNRANEKTLALINSILPKDRNFLESRQVFQSPVHRLGRLPNSREAKRVFAFSGLAQPNSFIEEVKRQFSNAQVDVQTFRDHFKYDTKTTQELVTQAQSYDMVITTEKDMVKLMSWPFSGPPLFVLGLGQELSGPVDLFYAQIDKLF